MIHLRTKDGIFNYRVAGILIRDNKILLHQMSNENIYSLPGGRVEINEDSKNALKREFYEEIDIKVEIDRLLWINESFFRQKNVRHHELCFYYLIHQIGGSNILENEQFYGKELAKNGFPFLKFFWKSIDEVKSLPIRPPFLKTVLHDIPKEVVHIISNQS